MMGCKATLVLEITSYIFSWALKLLRDSNFGLLFNLSQPNHVREQSTAPSNLCMEIMRDHLSLTTLGEKLQGRRESCDTKCAVCLERLRNSDQVWELGNCSHFFHSQCLERWLLYDARMTCPLCRASLINLTGSIGPLLSSSTTTSPQPSWAVEQLLYFFGDDLIRS